MSSMKLKTGVINPLGFAECEITCPECNVAARLSSIAPLDPLDDTSDISSMGPGVIVNMHCPVCRKRIALTIENSNDRREGASLFTYVEF